MSPAEIWNESLLFNSKTNTIFEKDDFRTLSCSSFFQSVLPQQFMRYDLMNQEIWFQQKSKDSGSEKQFAKQRYDIENNVVKFLDDQVELAQKTKVLDEVIKAASEIKGIPKHSKKPETRQTYLQGIKQIIDSIQLKSPEEKKVSTSTPSPQKKDQEDKDQVQSEHSRTEQQNKTVENALASKGQAAQ